MISNLFCVRKGDKKKKKKSESGSSTSSNSRSSTLTIATEALLIPLLPLLQSWVRTDQGLPVSISPLFSGYVDEIVRSDRINETYLAKPLSGTSSFTVFYKLAFCCSIFVPDQFHVPRVENFF